MRDLKANSSGHFRTGSQRGKANRKKIQKQPLELRQILHRSLRVVVLGFSCALVVVGLVLMLQLLVVSDLFRVAQISVHGEKHLSREEILALSDIQPGISTFALNLKLIGRKLEGNPWISKARVERIFPRQVKIVVTERKPMAIINLGYLYYLDQNGEIFKVLGPDDSFNFPVVTGFNRTELIKNPRLNHQELEQVVALIENLKARRKFNLAQISEVHQEKNGGLTLFTLIGGVAVKLGEGDLSGKLDRLERIYTRLKPRLGLLDYIYMNVDKRIIVGIQRQHTSVAG